MHSIYLSDFERGVIVGASHTATVTKTSLTKTTIQEYVLLLRTLTSERH